MGSAASERATLCYDIRLVGEGALDVRAYVPKGARGTLRVDPNSVPYVTKMTIGAHAIGLGGSLDECEREGCELAYTFDLGRAARELDDVDTASQEGETLVAPPSTWLVVPSGLSPETRVRFSVNVPPPNRFVSGASVPVGAPPNTYEFALADLEMSPYSAFGRFERRTLSVGNASVEIARAPGTLGVTDDEITAWTRASFESVVAYFGQPPVSHHALLIFPGKGPWVGAGKTLAGGGASIVMRVGDTATANQLDDDWVLTHEQCHLAGPSFPRHLAWIEEGLATYVEPMARVHTSRLSERDMWRGLFEGLPQGRPEAGDRGLDATPTWGRTYWGGAAFYFVADVEIRKATGNQKGLIDALRGVLSSGGNNLARWDVERWLTTADRASGTTVFHDLHRKMGEGTWYPDLPRLANELGVRVEKNTVTLNEHAPHATVRHAMTRPFR